MNDKAKATAKRGINVTIKSSWLFVLFFLAKVFGLINWSWWWVFAPIWLPWAIILTIFGVIAVFFVVAAVVSAL